MEINSNTNTKTSQLCALSCMCDWICFIGYWMLKRSTRCNIIYIGQNAWHRNHLANPNPIFTMIKYTLCATRQLRGLSSLALVFYFRIHLNLVYSVNSKKIYISNKRFDCIDWTIPLKRSFCIANFRTSNEHCGALQHTLSFNCSIYIWQSICHHANHFDILTFIVRPYKFHSFKHTHFTVAYAIEIPLKHFTCTYKLFITFWWNSIWRFFYSIN